MKSTKVNLFKEQELGIIQSLGGKVEEFNLNSFRITFTRFRIDYFPSSNRIFYHSNRKWGHCYDIIAEIESLIKEAYKPTI